MRWVLGGVMGFSDKATRVAIIVLATALLARVALCLVIVPMWESRAGFAPAPDAYPVLAASLVEEGELGYGVHGASPTSLRGPVFPAWLAAALIVGVSGPHLLALWASVPGIVLAAGLSAWLTRRRGTLAGLVGGLILALHPLPAWVSARVMSDEFHGALGAAALLAWCLAGEASERTRTRWTVTSGLLLALHLLTRAAGLLTLFVIVLDGVRAPRRRQLVLVAFLALTPALLWSVRTSRLEGRPVFVHSLAAYNFWIGEAQHRQGMETMRGENTARRSALILERAGRDSSNAASFWYGTLAPREIAAMERTLAREALEHVREHPLDYAQRVALGVVRFWVAGETKTRTLQYCFAVTPLLVLAGLGAFTALRGRDAASHCARLFGFLLVLTTLAHAAIVPFARYSVPLYPALAVLGALGASWIAQRAGWDGVSRGA